MRLKGPDLVLQACGAWLGMSILIKLFSWEGFTPDISDDVEMVTMQTLNDEVGYSGTVEPLDHCANTLIGIDGRCFDRDFAQTVILRVLCRDGNSSIDNCTIPQNFDGGRMFSCGVH